MLVQARTFTLVRFRFRRTLNIPDPVGQLLGGAWLWRLGRWRRRRVDPRREADGEALAGAWVREA
jgi:hypothetical protein